MEILTSLSAPTQLVWLISIVLGILGIVATFVNIPFVSANAFWVVVAAWVVMTLGTTLKGV